MKEINFLRPFRKLCMSIGELPTSYLESMTYYEMIEWLCKYLSEQVVPTVNNNGEVIKELQDYIEHYFDNLDVQEEINNKLDKMAEDGTLDELIGNYINERMVRVFSHVDVMKNQELEPNMNVRTLGYYSINDGGGALYHITSNEPSSYYEELDNGLYAQLIFDKINVKQFGAYGDGTHDDTNVLKSCVTLSHNLHLDIYSPANNTYLINETLYINESNLDFNDSILTTNTRINLITIDSDNYYGVIKNLTLDCKNANCGIMVTKGRKKTFENIKFVDIGFYGFYFDTGYEILLKDSHFNGDGISECIGIYANASDSKFENIVMIDCFKSIVNKGANFFEYVHSWIKTSNLVNNSIMFDLQRELAIIDQCYIDTYKIGINLNGGYATINQLKVFNNNVIYPSSVTNPILFNKTSNTTDSHLYRTSIVNSDLRGMQGKSLKYVETLPSKIKCSNNNLSTVLNYDGGIIESLTSPSSAITNVAVNQVTLKNGMVNINLQCQIDTNVSNNATFNLPSAIYQPNPRVTSFISVGTTQYNNTEVGYVFIGTNLQLTVPDNDTVKWIKLNITYPIANENS